MFGHIILRRCSTACARAWARVCLLPQEKQKKDLDAFQRREQQLAEVYYKNKPLCYSADFAAAAELH